ncbi:hypothetical protein MTO96_024285 [Rhipicephalus appendiculatus]
MKAPTFFVLQILCLLGQHGATQSRRYDDARIADELGRLLKRSQLPRYTGPDFHLEYPVLAKNGVTLAASGLVSEVNVYVIASLVAAVVVLFTTYCAYIIAKHVTRLLMDSVPGPVPQEQTLLLQAAK